MYWYASTLNLPIVNGSRTAVTLSQRYGFFRNEAGYPRMLGVGVLNILRILTPDILYMVIGSLTAEALIETSLLPSLLLSPARVQNPILLMALPNGDIQACTCSAP